MLNRDPNRTSFLIPGVGIAVGLLIASALRRVTSGGRHVAGPDGFVHADPADLASAAGVALDVYALSAVLQSEEADDRGRLAVGCAVWNAAKRDRSRILGRLAPSGWFGTQAVNPYASTAKRPSFRALQLAQAIVDGRVPDMVQGAVQWDAPSTQDTLHALYLSDPERYPKYTKTSAQIAERRRKAGAREVWVPGVPRTRFWTYAK
jgi:hypothetical protein